MLLTYLSKYLMDDINSEHVGIIDVDTIASILPIGLLSWLFNYWKASDVFVNICDNCMSLTTTVAPAPNFMYRTDVKYSDANTNFSADGIDLLRAVGIIKSPQL